MGKNMLSIERKLPFSLAFFKSEGVLCGPPQAANLEFNEVEVYFPDQIKTAKWT